MREVKGLEQMVEILKDFFIVGGRILTIIPLLLIMSLFMGKRIIAELPIFDFLIVLILGSLVGADIADPDIQHLPTAFAIVAIAIFQRILAKWKLSNRKVRKMLSFEPTVVIQNGKFINQNLTSIRYSVDTILQMLRGKNVFDVSEVEIAIIEGNGALSVLKKVEKNPVTPEDLNIRKPTSSISFPVIIDGIVYADVLKQFNLNEAWLDQHLLDKGVHDTRDVFFASVNRKLELHLSLRDKDGVEIPPIKD